MNNLFPVSAPKSNILKIKILFNNLGMGVGGGRVGQGLPRGSENNTKIYYSFVMLQVLQVCYKVSAPNNAFGLQFMTASAPRLE